MGRKVSDQVDLKLPAELALGNEPITKAHEIDVYSVDEVYLGPFARVKNALESRHERGFKVS